MFNRFKKFITLVLCAALLNACVLPSSALFAVKSNIIAAVAKSSGGHGKNGSNKQETSDEENPTIQDTWQKLKNFEWKELNRADAWNIAKVAGGAGLSIAVTYAFLYKSKPSDNNPNQGHKPNMPDDKPNAIPTIPSALQLLINNDQYEPEYKQKIQDLCNNDYRKQLQKNGLIDLRNQLIQEIGQTSNPTPDNIKHLIERHHNVLQKHLENGKIIKQEVATTNHCSDANKTTASTNTPEEENTPKSEYPFAEQAQKNNALTDVTVPRQKGLLCAIHALYDGNYINEKFTEDNATTITNLNNLPLLAEHISQERANANFATYCDNWTNHTGRKRKADTSEKYISHQLHRCTPLTQEEQAENSGFLNYLLRIVSGSPLHTLTSKERNSCNLIASIMKDIIAHNDNPQDILLWHDSENINLEDLYNNILNLAQQSHRNLDDVQKNDLRAFINALDTAQLKIYFNGTLAIDETQAKNHVYSYHPHLSTDFTGENLDSDELNILIKQMGKDYSYLQIRVYDNEDKYIKTDFILDAFNANDPDTEIYNLNGKISIIQDTALITPNGATPEEEYMKAMIKNQTYQLNLLDTYDGNIIAVIKHQMNQCNKFVHTFMIRLGAVKVGSASSTHWISVTLVRCNNKNHYFMTDSMNTQYANSENLQLNIKQLINAIEQPYVPHLIEQVENVDNTDNTTSSSSTTDNDASNTPVVIDENKKMSAIDQEFLNALNDMGINNAFNAQSPTQTLDQNPTNTTPLTPSTDSAKLASISTIAQRGSSCAYHALNNANTILQLINEGIPADNFEDTATYISNALCTDTFKANITALFNEIEEQNPGEWRHIIRTKRLPDALKESIFNKLLQSIPRTQEQITQYDEEMAKYQLNKINWDERKNKRGYRSEDPMPYEPKLPLSIAVNGNVRACLRNIAQTCATQLISTNNTINLADEANLQDILINVIRTTNAALLENSGEIDHNNAIALLDADELTKNFGKEITIATAMKNNNQQTREIIGDDLDADELQLLFDNANIENARNISIIARAQASAFAGVNSHALADVIDIVKAKIASSDTCAHAFLIRSGFSKEVNDLQDEMNQSNHGTHWICVVLYRINGHNHYIIADSLTSEKANTTNTALNKNNRTADIDVNYLIAMLES